MSQCKMLRLLSGHDCKSMPSTTETVSLEEENNPVPVIFHDGRLAKKPKPFTVLLILLWFPIGVILTLFRMILIFSIPMCVIPYDLLFLGIYVKVKGNVPPPPKSYFSGGGDGILFVCNHRTSVDPTIISNVLGRKIPAVTKGLSKITEMLSPIRLIGLTRVRHVDAVTIKRELEKGGLIICPEAVVCREPFLIRFSSLFAELTDNIVPVAINHNPLLFHAARVRGSRALCLFFYFMNPVIIYEVTFLDKIKIEADATCSAGGRERSHKVANRIQALIASTLGFTATTLTRNDMHEICD